MRRPQERSRAPVRRMRTGAGVEFVNSVVLEIDSDGSLFEFVVSVVLEIGSGGSLFEFEWFFSVR